MKTLSLISLTALVLAPALNAAQDPYVQIPITQSDAAAETAFRDWLGAVVPKLNYPVQVRVDMEASVEMGGYGGPDMKMDMDLAADMLLEGTIDHRAWGNFEMDARAMQEDVAMAFDFQYGLDAKGMRFMLDDRGTLQELIGMEIPKAYHLSADRVEKLSALYMELIVESMALYGEDAAKAFSGMEGIGEVMHPANIPGMLVNGTSLVVTGWGTQEGMGRIRTRINLDGMEALLGEDMPFDMSDFEDMVFEMLVDLESGQMVSYRTLMDLGTSVPLQDGSGSEMDMSMELHMSVRVVPVDADAPGVILPPVEEVVQLDSYFDQYYPMIEMLMDMQMQQMQQMRGEEEAEDDFDF